MPKVSIIVPVYKVEAYLEKCLTSLVNQTLQDIEIIVVNDGSPDHCAQIMQQFETQYPEKIKCIYQENQGLSGARNTGIQAAQAPYLAFVDSDDYVDSKMYEAMYQKAIEKDFDMVVCDAMYTYPDGKMGQIVKNGLQHDYFSQESLKKVFHQIYPVAWNKLYRKTLFQGELFFKEKVWYEDVELLFRMFPYIEKVGIVPQAYYYYLQREGQITQTFDKRIYHYIDNWNGMLEFYKKNHLYDQYYLELDYNYTRYLFATFLKTCCKFDYANYKVALKRALREVKIHFPKRYRNPYFYHTGIKGIYLLCFHSILGKILYYFKKTIVDRS